MKKIIYTFLLFLFSGILYLSAQENPKDSTEYILFVQEYFKVSGLEEYYWKQINIAFKKSILINTN